MIYTKGDRVIDFNEESISKQDFQEFADNHKHLEWDEEELTQVYSLITKRNKPKKAEKVKPEPPSPN